MSKYLMSFMVFFCVSFLFFAGCESDAQTGAVIGSLAGAGIGQLAGGDTESTLIGGTVGGGAGYIIGNEQDKKKQRSGIDTQRQETNTVTMKITNSNGSVTTVKLRRQGAGYVGEKGEYYDHLPTEEELQGAYGF